MMGFGNMILCCGMNGRRPLEGKQCLRSVGNLTFNDTMSYCRRCAFSETSLCEPQTSLEIDCSGYYYHVLAFVFQVHSTFNCNKDL